MLDFSDDELLFNAEIIEDNSKWYDEMMINIRRMKRKVSIKKILFSED
jgi:hypothetical protein